MQVELDGTVVRLGRRRERLLLGLLLLEAGSPVAVDRLIELVWPGEPPAAPRAALHTYISRLRRSLLRAGAPAPLITMEQQGYRIDAERGSVDACRFADLVDAAGTLGVPAHRSAQLAEALALWRGPPLADVVPPELRDQLGARLVALRERATRMRIDADLASGRHEELLAELAQRVAEQPLDEAYAGYLMVALYRSGRRNEALAVYRRTRERIAEELGLDPTERLRDLERAILRDDPEPVRPVRIGGDQQSPRAVPALLPAAPAGFVGRADQLARLGRVLAGGPSTVVISAISGAGGVGKTALAVHWAHRVGSAFPDGQLYLDLRGWSEAPPLSPLAALAYLLKALGVPDEQIPADPDAAAAAYRSTLAGRRVLVLLDNAGSAEQVRPLLPGAGPSATVVTSRDRLIGLVASPGAHRLDLDVLTAEEAVALLAGILGAERVAAEPAAAARLAELCGRLPLAVRIAAAQLTGRPDASIAGYATALEAGDRLGTLAVPGDPGTAVAATFDLSYRRLAAGQRRMFRLLGLIPGTDLPPPAAAALAGVAEPDAERLLADLAAVHLVEWRNPDRYAQHDLLRRYAAQQSRRDDPAAERQAALARLYRWYLARANRAAAQLTPQAPRLDPDPTGADSGAVAGAAFTDQGAALDWLDAERHNLVAAVVQARDAGQAGLAIPLGNAVRTYLGMRCAAVDLVQVGAGVRAAAGDDPLGQAVAGFALTSAESVQGRRERAIAYQQAALGSARAAGWAAGVAVALSNLGFLYWEIGRLDRASECHLAALDAERRTGGRAARARLLARIGQVELDRGRCRQASEHFRQALVINQELGNRLGVAIDRNSLGHALHALGELDAASEHVVEALALARAGKSRLMEASALDTLAMLHRDADRLGPALTCVAEAVAIIEELSVERAVADVFNTRGTVVAALGRPAEAIADHRRALELAHGTGRRTAEIQAHLGLSAALAAAGRSRQAVGHAERARTIAAEGGFEGLYGQALTALAQARLALGETAAAIDAARAAAAVHRRTSRGFDLARTRELITRAEAHVPR